VPAVEHAAAERLGERQRDPGRPGVVAQQPVGVREAGDGHAVLRLGIVDAVPPADVAAGLLRHVKTAAQHLAGDLQGQHVPGPAEQVHRHQRAPAHRVDVGERVGGRDPAPVVGVVDDGGEEVGGQHDGLVALDAHDRRVVAGRQPDQEVGAVAGGHQSGQHLLELAGWDLAGAAAAVGVLREPDRGRGRHPADASLTAW